MGKAQGDEGRWLGILRETALRGNLGLLPKGKCFFVVHKSLNADV